jgi:hypothetical protein
VVPTKRVRVRALRLPTRLHKTKKLTKEEVRFVVQFFQSNQLLGTSRGGRPRSLADWRRENQSADKIWDSKQFSVQSFMSEYIKKRTEQENMLMLRRQKVFESEQTSSLITSTATQGPLPPPTPTVTFPDSKGKILEL